MLSDKKKIFSILIITFAVPLTVYFTILGIKYFSHAAANTVSLSFSQKPVNVNTSTPTPLNVVLNAGTNQIGFAEIAFTFDKTKVNLASEITTTPLLKSPQFLGQGNTAIFKTTMADANATGKVSVILGLDPSDVSNPPTGSINLASFSLIAIATGSSNLSFTAANIKINDLSSNTLAATLTNSTVKGPTPLPTPTPTPSPTPTATPVVTASPTSIATATPSISPSISPTASASPSSTPGTSNLNFAFKFQGIGVKGPDKVIAISVKNGSNVIFTNNAFAVTSDNSGIYSGVLTGLTPGTYDIFIKDENHLQKKFSSVALADGANSIDWTGTPLKSGDFNNDNKITIQDIALILTQYTQLSTPVNANNMVYDLNSDGNINIIDISLALSNYTQLVVNGD